MTKPMRFDATATFTHPDWLRAISAQVPGADLFEAPATGLPKLVAAVKSVRLPIHHYDSWITPLTPAGLPAMAPGIAPPVDDLLEGLEAPVIFRNIPLTHPVAEALMSKASQTFVLDSWERAGLDVSGDYETWLSENFDHKRRKEFKRLKARLGETGVLEIRTLEPGGALEPFVKGLLELEAKGWKGERGTALAQDERLAKALWNALSTMHERGRVRFWQMTLDGRPVASLFALIDGSEACLGKIAYDEAFSKFSPGVLIILEATRALFAEDGIMIADGNAIPNHPMIDRIWRDRIPCADVLAAGQAVPTPVFRALAFYLTSRMKLRAALKSVFVRVTGRKVS